MKKDIYEGIVKSGKGNYAPMGYSFEGKRVEIFPFSDSGTYKNVKENERYVLFFPKGAFQFYNALKKNSVSRKGCTGSWEVSVDGIKMSKGRARIIGTVEKRVGEPNFISRAEPLFLEALIKYTRIGYFGSKKDKELKKEIKEIKRVIEKVAPTSIYARKIGSLL